MNNIRTTILALALLAAMPATRASGEPPSTHEEVIVTIQPTGLLDLVIADNVSTMELDSLTTSALADTVNANPSNFALADQVNRRRWETIAPITFMLSTTMTFGTDRMQAATTAGSQRRSMYAIESTERTTFRESRRRPHLASAAM